MRELKSGLVIRADASPAIGAGHLMRCLALAQTWRRAGGHVVFALGRSLTPISERLVREGFEQRAICSTSGTAADARETAGFAAEVGASWIAADGYVFDSRWQIGAKEHGARLLAVDDIGHVKHHNADLVLNQNPYASAETFSREPHTRLLLGPTYALLRDEFARIAPASKPGNRGARRILVTMGGTDPVNATSNLIPHLNNLPETRIVVVVGSSGIHFRAIQQTVAAGGRGIEIVVDPPDMRVLMEGADLAISGAGSTCWELAYLGVPMAVVVLAANQANVARQLCSSGAAIPLGEFPGLVPEEAGIKVAELLGDQDRLAGMADTCRKLIDGRGRNRVLAQMRAIEITLQPARMKDAETLWRWSNNAAVRAASFSPCPIPWAEHVRWLENRLQDPLSHTYLAIHTENPIGQVRFDRDANGARISASLAPEWQGRGWGAALIAAGCHRFFRDDGSSIINAFIKKDNQSSLKAFSDAGFVSISNENMAPAGAAHYRLNRPDHE